MGVTTTGEKVDILTHQGLFKGVRSRSGSPEHCRNSDRANINEVCTQIVNGGILEKLDSLG